MQVDLFDTNALITKNNLQEVSDPMLFIKGTVPSPKGLLSTEIFGVAVRDRKTTFAYVDLHSLMLHPYIFKLLKRINRNFESCVHGTKTFKIEDGKLVEDPNGETGVGFLYKNWDKFKFESDDISSSRELRVGVLRNYTKNELFTKKWIVIPAFYRDVNFENMDSGRVSHRSELNDKYGKLIRLSNLLSTDNAFDTVLLSTKAKEQDTLVEIYDFLKSKLAKKEGMLRRNLMGKSVDYASRCVISAPTFKYNSPNEMVVNYTHTGVPLAHCCSLFTPFIIAWVRNFFRQRFVSTGNKVPYKKTEDAPVQFYEVDDIELYYTDDVIQKEIDNFIKNFHDRFKPILIPVKAPEKFVYFNFIARNYDGKQPTSESNISHRPATWCDLLYQAAVEVTKDKHIYITRYPISDYFSIYPNKISVITTMETESVYIDDKVYAHYPKIDMNMSREDISIAFNDTITLSNIYLAGLGGDELTVIVPLGSNAMNKLCERLTSGVRL